jgi:hypothetical protein
MCRCTLSLLLVGFLIASVEGAAACGNGKLILEDKFATLDPAWDFKNSDPTDTSTRTNGPGGLTYQLDEEALVWPLNTAAKHENYEVCAGFETKSSADDMYLVGVRFWSLDDDNYYEANIFPTDQTYEINAYKQGKSVGGADDKQDDAIVKGESVTNEISVTVNGNVATPLVNGKKVADVTGQPPSGGSYFGFVMSTDEESTATVTLKSIQLREVGTAQP